jgi:hypothetical protein
MFPSRVGYFFDPAVPNRQMWAIGMVVAQWSMTEMMMHNSAQKLTGEKTPLWEEYANQASFRHHLRFYKNLVETKVREPKRTRFLSVVAEIQRLKSQRDRVMHQPWGGGMEGDSPSSEGIHPTTDARIIPGHFQNPEWNLDFARLRQLARELSLLNGKFAEMTLLLDTTEPSPPGAQL